MLQINTHISSVSFWSTKIAVFLGHIFTVFLLVSTFVYAEGYESKPTEIVHKNSEKKQQTGFFYGAMLAYKTDIYKGVNNDFMALPAIGYRGENINVLGPLVTYSLIKSEGIEFSSLLSYRFAGYDTSDSDVFNGMEDRDASLDFGFALSYKKDKWAARLGILHDIIGSSNGFEVAGSLGKTFYFGPIFVEPNVGVSYLDNQFVDYYYGVESFEATATRESYKGEFALNNKLGLNISTPIFFKGFTRLGLAHTWYDSSISNSPLTDDNSSFSARLTFTRFF